MNIYILIMIGVVFGYLFGSIPTALIISKGFYKIDIRKHGSGNLGSTNVNRTLGPKAGVIVMILDILKGGIPAFTMYKISELIFLSNTELENLLPYLSIIYCVTAIFTSIGHCYSIFAKFKGGKAVACICGFLLFMNFKLFLVGIIVYALGIIISKMVSVGSISAAVLVFLVSFIPWFNESYLFRHDELSNPTSFLIYRITIIFLALLLIIKHIPNIIRIIKGTESKVIKNKK